MFAGMGAGVFGSLGIKTIVLGVKAYQAFGLGAAVFNMVAWGVMPLFGIDMQGIDYETPNIPNIPKPQPNTHPGNRSEITSFYIVV
jgi:hypothetical protein